MIAKLQRNLIICIRSNEGQVAKSVALHNSLYPQNNTFQLEATSALNPQTCLHAALPLIAASTLQTIPRSTPAKTVLQAFDVAYYIEIICCMGIMDQGMKLSNAPFSIDHANLLSQNVHTSYIYSYTFQYIKTPLSISKQKMITTIA